MAWVQGYYHLLSERDVRKKQTICMDKLHCMEYSVHVGFFMEPTIFTNVEDHMFVAKEESFGPVMVISIFENG